MLLGEMIAMNDLYEYYSISVLKDLELEGSQTTLEGTGMHLARLFNTLDSLRWALFRSFRASITALSKPFYQRSQSLDGKC